MSVSYGPYKKDGSGFERRASRPCTERGTVYVQIHRDDMYNLKTHALCKKHSEKLCLQLRKLIRELELKSGGWGK